MIDLGDFLARAARRTRDPGAWDCCTFPAQWAIENGHADPMARWRGAYADEETGLRVAACLRGLPGAFDLALREVGLVGVPVASVREGDIGVVRLFGAEAGAVYAGRRWAFVTDRGLGFATVADESIVAAWRPAPWEKR